MQKLLLLQKRKQKIWGEKMIDLGFKNYYLGFDKWCYVIKEKRFPKAKSGEDGGEPYFVDLIFPRRLEHLVGDLIEIGLRDENCTKISEMAKIHKKFIKDFCKSYEEVTKKMSERILELEKENEKLKKEK